jgi:hypothetical protein
MASQSVHNMQVSRINGESIAMSVIFLQSTCLPADIVSFAGDVQCIFPFPYELLSLPGSQQYASTVKIVHRDCKLLAEAGWPAHSLLYLAPFILLVIEVDYLFVT